MTARGLVAWDAITVFGEPPWRRETWRIVVTWLALPSELDCYALLEHECLPMARRSVEIFDRCRDLWARRRRSSFPLDCTQIVFGVRGTFDLPFVQKQLDILCPIGCRLVVMPLDDCEEELLHQEGLSLAEWPRPEGAP